MGQRRVQPSPSWLALAIVLIGANLATIRTALAPRWDWTPGVRIPGVGLANTAVRYNVDGSVWQYIFPFGTGARIGPIVVRRVSPPGLWRVWWPVVASAGLTLVILAAARIRTRLRPVPATGRHRARTIQVMDMIGLISFGLWLIRFDWSQIVAGSSVCALSLIAAYRRFSLVHEINIREGGEKALSIAGIAGYSVAILLASAWLISILWWDSYQHGRS
jgi:hypothetical protein